MKELLLHDQASLSDYFKAASAKAAGKDATRPTENEWTQKVSTDRVLDMYALESSCGKQTNTA